MPFICHAQTETELVVKEVFKNDPVMIEIARCESNYRQYNDDGTTLRGVVNPLDKGAYQLNEKYHLESSRNMGLDINTLQGNLVYAWYLHYMQGESPWSASKSCWNKPTFATR